MRDREALEEILKTVGILRSERGCPWDRAQTHSTLRRHLLEESYEVLESLDAHTHSPGPATAEPLKEELGDLLLQILLHSEISRQNGAFSFADVCRSLDEKLKRRHPHVFGSAKVESPTEALASWDNAKSKEKEKNSILEGIPKELPALQRSLKIIERVSKVGFQWKNMEGPMAKFEEELKELKDEIHKLGSLESITPESSEKLPPDVRKKLESELGDLLFCAANLAHFLHVNPEDSLRSMLSRFERRFRHIETRARASGRELKNLTLEEMDEFWNEAKVLNQD